MFRACLLLSLALACACDDEEEHQLPDASESDAALPDMALPDAAPAAVVVGPAAWEAVPIPNVSNRMTGQNTPPGPIEIGDPPPVETGRACASDLFAIDVLMHAPMPPNFSTKMEDVARSVEASANANRDWFSVPDACTLELVREDVFEGLEITDAFRHQRVWFRCEGMPAAVSVRPDSQCEVLLMMREALAEQIQPMNPGGFDPVRVSRDCEGRSQGSWHNEPGVLGDFPPLGATSPEQPILAIVDTPRGTPDEPSHGDLVEILARETLGEAAARIEVERWVGLPFYQTFGSTSHLARTLGELVERHRDHARPLIVNMSLGWPAEAGNESKLVQGECEVLEGSAGEAVRSALWKLHERRPMPLVFSAAGNRVYRDAIIDIQGVPNCGSREGSNKHMFPALWSVVNSCHYSDPTYSLLLSIGVGMTGPLGPMAPPELSEGRNLLAPGARLLIGGRPAQGTSYASAVAASVAARLSLAGAVDRNTFLTQHTCINLDGSKELRVNANGAPCALPEARVPLRLAENPNGCGDSDRCEQIDAPEDEEPRPVEHGALREPDQYSLGLGSPQPPAAPCPFTVCASLLNSGNSHTKIDFQATIGSGYGPGGATISNAKLVIFVGTTRHDIALSVSNGWVAGNTYFFNDKAIGGTYSTAQLQAATFYFECYVTDTNGTAFRSDPVQAP